MGTRRLFGSGSKQARGDFYNLMMPSERASEEKERERERDNWERLRRCKI